MRQVSIRELKSGLSSYLRRVQCGEALIVTSRRRPIAKLIAYPNVNELDDGLRRLLMMDGVEWDGQAPKLPTRCPHLEGEPAARAVLEGRR
jgi:prevent-host-death family protein